MGPPFVMGLSVGRDVSMSPPDESKIIIWCCKVGVSQTIKNTCIGTFGGFFLCWWAPWFPDYLMVFKSYICNLRNYIACSVCSSISLGSFMCLGGWPPR